MSNEKIVHGSQTLFDFDMVKMGLGDIEIPYIAQDISNNEEKFDNSQEIKDERSQKVFEVGEKIEYKIFAKAMNILEIDMEKIRIYDKNLNSKRKFYNKILSTLLLNFNKKQDFSKATTRLEIAKYILNNYKELINKTSKKFEISDFKVQKLVGIGSRKIIKNVEYNDDKIVFKGVEIALMSGFIMINFLLIVV